uniref:Uncharacterized protein n=1 Tax=Oryza glaberrima TaxID=4538 RepID=I1PBP0_ORYGL
MAVRGGVWIATCRPTAGGRATPCGRRTREGGGRRPLRMMGDRGTGFKVPAGDALSQVYIQKNTEWRFLREVDGEGEVGYLLVSPPSSLLTGRWAKGRRPLLTMFYAERRGTIDLTGPPS